MLKRIILSALLSLTLLNAVPPAEAGVLSKIGTVAKKILLFPVYTIGGGLAGAGAGFVAWWIFGGEEDQLH